MSDLTELTVPEFIARCAVKGTDDVYDHRDVVALLGNYHALDAENKRLRSQLELVRERLGGAPEINPSNYDHDEVVELNGACILAYFLAGGKPTNEDVPEYKQAQAELLDAARGRQG